MEIIDHIRNLPALAPEEIHVWGVHVPDMLDRLDRLLLVLNEHEREKAARFRRESDRLSSIAARGALRVLLGGYAGIPASEIRFTYSENGKPFLVPQTSRLPCPEGHGRRDACDTQERRKDAGGTIAFNVSHSGDWVVIAIGRDREIGVDIEAIKPEMDVRAIAKRYFLPAECAEISASENPGPLFFQRWARKEAFVKASGSTLFSELNRTPVPLEDGAERNGWFFHYLEAGSRHASAVVTDRPLKAMPCYDFTKMAWDGME
ncbi:MAG: 4'-phosphopantetheinyl transferase superfamily protein [Pontiellaceae bacterium]|nr:4'-phosphopantetheinyl transferase superfamily protein [Pontiellaceae bacterium]MBN2785963.1 4'-phosphopantetheinyl transferase superfamily protein [Pontiellaceae bacterium]